MSIKSYLCYAITDRFAEMVNELKSITGVDVHPADCGGMAVLITETSDKDSENQLQERLGSVQTIQSLALVYGHEL